MDTKGSSKCQEMHLVTDKRNGFFSDKKNIYPVSKIYNYLNKRERLSTSKINRLFRTVFQKKITLNFIPKLKEEIMEIYKNEKKLNNLLYKEAHVLNQIMKNIGKTYGEKLKKYYEIFTGYIANKLYLENSTSPKTDIDIQNSGLFKAGAYMLGSILYSNSTLTRLILPNNSIGGKGFKEFINCLGNIKGIVELDLSGNFIEKEGSEVLAKFLNHQQKLRILKLYNCLLKDEGVIALSPSLFRLNTLETLNLGSNLIGNKGFEFLLQSLLKCDNLHSLDLKENVIKSFRAASSFLCWHKRIRTLDLSMNIIGSQNLSELREGLLKTSSLETLNLNNCNIQYFAEFFDGLPNTSTLASINLSHNHLKDPDQTYISLCKLLKNNSTLQEIIWLKGLDVKFIENLGTYVQQNKLSSSLKIKYISTDKIKVADLNEK